MEEKNDQILIDDYFKGNEKSLEMLIKKYLKQVYNFAYSYFGEKNIASDVTQEIFVKMWKNLRKFNRKKDFKVWLFTIAKNTIFDFLGKKKQIPFSNFEFEDYDENQINLIDNLEENELLPEKIFEKIETKEKINSAIKKLTPIYREVILFYYYHNFSLKEISEILNEPVNTVKSRHLRALQKLKVLLDADLDIE